MVHRDRADGVDDAHRDRVRHSTDHAIEAHRDRVHESVGREGDEQAEVLSRLKDADVPARTLTT